MTENRKQKTTESDSKLKWQKRTEKDMTINIQLFCCDEPSKLRRHDFFMSTSVTGDFGDPGTRVGPGGRDQLLRLLTALMPACDQTAVVERSEARHLCRLATNLNTLALLKVRSTLRREMWLQLMR